MLRAIRNPIDSKPLVEIAAGKKTACILFDDLSRPTPANIIAPMILDELNTAGIKDDNILMISMLGCHWAMTHPQVLRKLGWDVVNRVDWMNHNCFDNFAKLGKTKDGIPIEINDYFYNCDVKIAMGNLKKHGAIGYSGGSKCILPGVSSLNSVEFHHANSWGGRLGAIYHNNNRDNVDEIADKAGLNFITQTCSNGDRQTIRMWAGHHRQTWKTGAVEAIRLFQTKPVENADVVIANAYPYTIDEWQKFDWANYSLREGGTAVTIMQSPLARIPIHYWTERSKYRRSKGDYWRSKGSSNPVRKAGKIIIYSQYLHKRDMHYVPGRVQLCREWSEVLAEIEKLHGPKTYCAVYPYVGIQHEPLEVDKP